MLKLATTGFVVAGKAEIDGDGNGVSRIESEVDGESALQASHYKHSADQQDHRERDLRRHQDFARMPAAQAGIVRSILERGNQIGSGGLECWSEAEQQS